MANQGPTEDFIGLAMASRGGQNDLDTAEPRFSPGSEAFNSSWRKVTLVRNRADPRLPAGFTPQIIQSFDGLLFVACLGAAPGSGAVAEFKTSGTFARQFRPSGPGGGFKGCGVWPSP